MKHLVSRSIGLVLGASFALIASSTLGCGPSALPLPNVREVAGLRVYLRPITKVFRQVNSTLTPGNSEETPRWAARFASVLQDSLTAVGLVVVPDASSPHDLEIEATFVGNSFGEAGEGVYEAQITALDGTKVIDSESWSPSLPVSVGPAVAASLVVAPLAQSSGLRRFASARGNQSPTAVAQPSPPPGAPPAGPSIAHASATPQRTAYGLVIGIEKYRDLPAPTGARGDAESFATMLKTTLGIPDSNVRVALDDRATGKDIERNLAWLKANVPPGGRVYFFFSGHGAPDPSKGTAYLVPYEGDAQSIDDTAIPLDKVLAALGETKAKETLAFVDSCFSGSGGRSVIAKGTRPLVKLKAVSEPAAVVLFSASSGTQISGPSAEGNRGAFTKYLVQGIGEAKADANGDGQLTLQELADWVTPRVEREAKAQSREQTPKLAVGQKAGAPKDLAVAWGLK